jgi:hypothetical protein
MQQKSIARAANRAVETLERRTLLSISVQFDYSLDTAQFFTSEKRAVLQAAADSVVSQLGDNLTAVTVSGNNHYTATIFNPETLSDTTFSDRDIPADTLLIFVGTANFGPLGLSRPTSVDATGGNAFVDRATNRGQGDTTTFAARDFGPIGGSISFDANPFGGWYFGTDPNAINGANDFFSVAAHEVCHVLGVGSAPSWTNQISGTTFNGPAVVYERGSAAPLNGGKDHFQSSLTDNGQEVAMDPELTQGTKKNLTGLDYAALDDIGWEFPLGANVSTGSVFPAAGTTSVNFTVTYSHYAKVPSNTLSNDDVVVHGPNGFTANASVVSTGSASVSRTVTYSFTAPGGKFDGADSGAYTVTLNQDAVGDTVGNFAPGGTIGSFAVDVNTGPAASLTVDNVTRVGGSGQAFTITYTDSTGVDAETIDPANLSVTRTTDGLPLTVSSATVTDSTATSKTVTYVATAPGGLWDAGDNGTYNISLNGSQVKDIQGIASDAATLGSFDVTITAVAFSSGNPLTFTDSTGDPVTISMSGPGGGQAFFTGPGNADLVEVILHHSAVSTGLTIAAGGAGTPLGALTVNGSLKSVTGKNTDLAGAMTVVGPAPRIQFRNATGSIDVSGVGAPVTIAIAEASDLSITSASPIKSVKINNWHDTDATPDVLSAPTIGTIAVKGGMAADVSAGSIGKVTVGGELSGSTIRATDSITSVSVGTIAHSKVFAGVRDDVTTLPDSADDFADPTATINTFSVKSKLSGSFSDTLIAGSNLGKVAVGTVDTTNAGVPFGVAALTIKSITGTTDVGGPLKASKLDLPGSSISLGDFRVRLL